MTTPGKHINQPASVFTTPAEKALFREWLLDMLSVNDTVEVTFTKKDGTERVLNCTTKTGKRPETKSPRKSETNCTVWDLEKEAWRSFNFDNVITVRFSA